MFKALMGGGRSSSDARSTVSSSSKSSRRRADSTKSSHSRKSSRGDDRDRGLDDPPYSPSASGSRRGPSSVAGDSVASTYVTAEPESFPSPVIIERTPKRRDSDRESKSSRRRTRDRSESRDRGDKRKSRRATDDTMDADLVDDRDLRERTRAGDAPYVPPISTSMPPSAPAAQFATDTGGPAFAQFPGQFDPVAHSSQSTPHAPHHDPYDPHVQQQFPGQFPTMVAEPYFPPNNPAGAAADYYGDQGQSVSEQPGIRPQKPSVIPNSQAHLMAASPSANPPPEPSSLGQTGAAAAYFDDDFHVPEPPASSVKPPKPGKISSKPTKPSASSSSSAIPSAAALAAAGAAAYGLSSGSSSYHNEAQAQAPAQVQAQPQFQSQFQSQSQSQSQIQTQTQTSTSAVQHSTSYSQQPTPTSGPPHSHSHGIGAGVGLAAAGAAAGYMLGHEHHSASPEDHAQPPYQNYGQPGPSGPPSYSSGPNNGMLPPGPAGYPMQNPGFYPHGTGALAMRHRPKGPVSKFADFWRDPEGVGRFEDYTETIGVCKYCFEPGTTSIDAPRKHHYHARRHSSDRYSSSSASRVDKLSRYHSSEDESRRRKRSGRSNKSTSWLPGVLAGGLFAGKEFKDSYSVRPSRGADDRASSYDAETVSVSDRRSYTSRGVVRRSESSQEQFYSDSKYSRRNRSRSRSSSRSGRHSVLKEAALGAAVGGAALAVAKSHQRSRSRSPSRVQRRKESSSSSSYVDVSRPSSKSVGGFTSFFTSSENRKKKRSKRRGFFSFNSSSSSSLDADLAFGSGFSKKSKSKQSKKDGKKKKKDEDIDATLLGLGATATALAAASHGRSRSTGQILTARESRSRHANYVSSANEDSEWIDAESEDQSSESVSSALAFGGSSADSGSDSSRGGWGFFGFNKKKKSKKEKKDRHSSVTNAALAAGAGALGGAALASVARNRDSRVSSSSGSLQQVYPVPTSDPSRFEAVHMSPSVISDQTPLVRPGPIPLQQPQPVTPVSQAVYTTQGGLPGSIPAYAAPEVSPVFNNRDVYAQQVQGSREPAWTAEELPSDRRHPRRSDSSPIFPVQESPISGVKRRSTTRDAASVSFALTEEQTQQQDRRDRKSRDSFADRPVQLVDLEEEEAKRRREYERREYERQEQERKEYERREFERQEQERRDHERREFERQELERQVLERQEAERQEKLLKEREEEERRHRDAAKEKDSSSWVETAAIAAATGAVASSLISRKSDDATASEANTDRYKERREKRRKEREQSRMEMESSVVSKPDIVAAPIDDVPTVEHEEVTKPRSPRRSPRSSPVYESYADFYVPEELRRSPDTHDKSRDVTSQPAIIERVPASERDSQGRRQPLILPDDHEDRPVFGPEPYENRDLPWEVPGLMLIKPTPDPSVNGSVTGTSSAPETTEVLPYVAEEVEDQPRESVPEPSPQPAAEESLDPIYEGWYELSSKERKKREKQLIRKGLPIPGKDGFELPSEKQPEPEPEHVFEAEPEWKPRSTTGSRVSWGHDKTHEYEVPSSSEHDPTDHDISPLEDPTKEFSLPASEDKSRDVGDKHKFGEDIEFAAILAAGTQAAGFDSAVVTDDPKYHTRTSPPGSEDEGTFSPHSKWTDVKEQPHGFVEGEVESRTPEASRDMQPFTEHVIENEPFYSEPETVSKNISPATETRQSTSIAEKVMEELNGKSERTTYADNDVFSMPGGFDTAEDTREISQYRDDSRSVFSAPPERETTTPTKSKKSRRSGDDFEFLRDAAGPVAATAAAAIAAETFDRHDDEHAEKKHRKHRSKRDSDTFSIPDDIDDTRSTVTVDDDEKSERRRRRHRSSRESDFIADDDVASVATAPDDGKSERRKHRHRSSRDFDDTASITSSPARIDEREKRRGKDEKEKSGGILRSIFGSRVSTSEEKHSSSRTSSRSSSLDKRPSRDAVSEAGVDEERRRRKRHSRHSSSGDKLEDYDSDKVSVKSEANLDEYRSKRQEKEERRRQRYGDIVESGKRRESDKDGKRSEYYDDDQSFLGESPETPAAAERVETGTSGLEKWAEGAALAAGGLALGEEFLHQRPRSRSTSPRAAEKAIDVLPKSQSRPSSPEMARDHTPRRMSLNRSTESPTAVPLHFRRPPTSPNLHRAVPAEFPSTPGSPSQSRHRRPKSVEYSGEMRPMYLVEQYGASKAEQPEVDEQLPSLPSSKTSSRAPSVENLRSLHDGDAVRSWEPIDPTPLATPTRPSGLTIATGHSNDREIEHDLLDSQQTTPTAATFDIPAGSAKKEKQKPEFYTLEDLLEDPEKANMAPPAEQPIENTKDLSEEPATVEDHTRELPAQTEPTADSTHEHGLPASAAAGLGFAGIVDAAVIDAVKSRDQTHESTDKELTEATSQEMNTDVADDDKLPENPLPTELVESAPSDNNVTGFSDIVNAAVAAEASTHDKATEELGEPTTAIEEQPPQQFGLEQSTDLLVEADSSRELVPESSEQPIEEEPVAEEQNLSKAQKKKNKKKAKKKQANENDLDSAQPAPDAEEKTPAVATEAAGPVEPEILPAGEAAVDSQVESVPVEASRELTFEPEVVPVAEEVPVESQTEPAPVETSRELVVEPEPEIPALESEALAAPEESLVEASKELVVEPEASAEGEAVTPVESAEPSVPETVEEPQEAQGLSKKEARKNKKKNKKNKSVTSVTQDEDTPVESTEKPVEEPVAPSTEPEIPQEEPSAPADTPIAIESAEPTPVQDFVEPQESQEAAVFDTPPTTEEASEFQEAREIQEIAEPSQPIDTTEIQEQKSVEIAEQDNSAAPTSTDAAVAPEAAETDEDAFEEAVEEQPDLTEEKRELDVEPLSETPVETPAVPADDTVTSTTEETAASVLEEPAASAPEEPKSEEPTETSSKKSKKTKKKNRKSVSFDEPDVSSEPVPAEAESQEASKELEVDQSIPVEPPAEEPQAVDEPQPSEPEVVAEVPEQTTEEVAVSQEPEQVSEPVPADDAEIKPSAETEESAPSMEQVENQSAADVEAEPEVPLTAAQKKAAKKAAKKKAKQQSVSSVPEEETPVESPVVESQPTEPESQPIEPEAQPAEPHAEPESQPTEPEAQAPETETQLTETGEPGALHAEAIEQAPTTGDLPESEQTRELQLESEIKQESQPTEDTAPEVTEAPAETEPVRDAVAEPQAEPQIEPISDEPPPGLSKSQKRKWKEQQKKLRQQSVSSLPEEVKAAELEPEPESQPAEPEVQAPETEIQLTDTVEPEVTEHVEPGPVPTETVEQAATIEDTPAEAEQLKESQVEPETQQEPVQDAVAEPQATPDVEQPSDEPPPGLSKTQKKKWKEQQKKLRQQSVSSLPEEVKPAEPESQPAEPEAQPTDIVQPEVAEQEPESVPTETVEQAATIEDTPAEAEKLKELQVEPETQPEPVQEVVAEPQATPEIEQLSDEPPPGLSKTQKKKWKEQQKKLRQQSLSSAPEEAKPAESESQPAEPEAQAQEPEAQSTDIVQPEVAEQEPESVPTEVVEQAPPAEDVPAEAEQISEPQPTQDTTPEVTEEPAEIEPAQDTAAEPQATPETEQLSDQPPPGLSKSQKKKWKEQQKKLRQQSVSSLPEEVKPAELEPAPEASEESKEVEALVSEPAPEPAAEPAVGVDDSGDVNKELQQTLQEAEPSDSVKGPETEQPTELLAAEETPVLESTTEGDEAAKPNEDAEAKPDTELEISPAADAETGESTREIAPEEVPAATEVPQEEENKDITESQQPEETAELPSVDTAAPTEPESTAAEPESPAVESEKPKTAAEKRKEKKAKRKSKQLEAQAPTETETVVEEQPATVESAAPEVSPSADETPIAEESVVPEEATTEIAPAVEAQENQDVPSAEEPPAELSQDAPATSSEEITDIPPVSDEIPSEPVAAETTAEVGLPDEEPKVAEPTIEALSEEKASEEKVPEAPTTEVMETTAEEPETPSTSSKMKKNKKKKKGQTATTDEEPQSESQPQSPKEEAPPTDLPTSEDAQPVTEEIAPESTVTEEAEKSLELASEEPQPETSISEIPVSEETAAPAPEETAASAPEEPTPEESTEESSKKSKKNKKKNKRKSVSFEDGADVTQAEEQSEKESPVALETTESQETPSDAPSAEPTTIEEQTEAQVEAESVVEPSADNEITEPKPAEVDASQSGVEESSKEIDPAETLETVQQIPDQEAETPADQQPEPVEEPVTPTADAEDEDPEDANLSAKERKKRKKQKEKERKKKAKSLELDSEEAPSPVEPSQEPEAVVEPQPDISEPVLDEQTAKPDESTAPDSVNADVEKQLEESAEADKADAETTQPGGLDIAGAEPEDAKQETDSKEIDDQQPAAEVAAESSAEVPPPAEDGPSEPTTEAEVEMTAEERRKAKKAEKKKKRKSKNLSTEDAADDSTAADADKTAAPETANLESNTPVTAPSPAEDDGKEHQSHDIDTPDLPAQTLTSTDDIVSSQVEQPQIESLSDYPPQPVLERSIDFGDASETVEKEETKVEEVVVPVAEPAEEPVVSEEKEVGVDESTKENVEEPSDLEHVLMEKEGEKEDVVPADLKEEEPVPAVEATEKEIAFETPVETPTENVEETVAPVSEASPEVEETEKSKKQKKKDKKKKKNLELEENIEEPVVESQPTTTADEQEVEPVADATEEAHTKDSQELEQVSAVEEPPVDIQEPSTQEPELAPTEEPEAQKELEMLEEPAPTVDAEPEPTLGQKMSKKEKKRAKQLEAQAQAQAESDQQALSETVEVPQEPSQEPAVPEDSASPQEPSDTAEPLEEFESNDQHAEIAEETTKDVEPVTPEEQAPATSEEQLPAEQAPEAAVQEVNEAPSTLEPAVEEKAQDPAPEDSADEYKGLSKKQIKKKKAEKAAAAAAAAAAVEAVAEEEKVKEEQSTLETAPEVGQTPEPVVESSPIDDTPLPPADVEVQPESSTKELVEEPSQDTAEVTEDSPEKPIESTEAPSAVPEVPEDVIPPTDETSVEEPNTPELSKKAKKKAKKKSKQVSADLTSPIDQPSIESPIEDVAFEKSEPAADVEVPPVEPQLEFDDMGQPIQSTRELEPQTQFDDMGQPIQTTRGPEPQPQFDDMGQPIKTSPGFESQTQFDDMGQPMESTREVDLALETQEVAESQIGEISPQHEQEHKEETATQPEAAMQESERDVEEPPQADVPSLDPKKMSKKELRKAKKKGLILESSPAESDAVVEKEPEAETSRELDLPAVSEPTAESTADSSESALKQQEPVTIIDNDFPLEEDTELKASTLQEHQDEDWPVIEWDNSKSDKPEPEFEQAAELERDLSLSAPEVIDDFDEKDTPEVPEEPEAAFEEPLSKSAKKKAKKNKRKSEQAALAQLDEPAQEPSQEKIALDNEVKDEPPVEVISASKEIETEPPARTVTPGGSAIANIFPNMPRAGFRLKRSTPSVKDDAHEETTADLEANRDIDVTIPVSEASPNATTTTKEIVEATAEPVFEATKDIDFSPEKDAFSMQESTKEPELPESNERFWEEPASTPMHSTSKERSSLLFSSSPSTRTEDFSTPRHLLPSQMEAAADESSCGLRRTPSIIHGRHQQTPRTWSLEEPSLQALRTPSPPRSLFGGPFGEHDSASRPRTPLDTIAEQEPGDGRKATTDRSGTPRLDIKPEHILPPTRSPARPVTPVRKFTDTSRDRETWPTSENEEPRRSQDELSPHRSSGGSGASPILKTPEQGMPVLRPSDSKGKLRRTNRSTSSDLRAASRALNSQPPSNLDLDQLPSSSSYDPVTDKGKRPLRNMSDVYEGWGETPSSPRSPSRPPSVRRRRSMQHLQDIETRLDQLISENRLLIAARDEAEDRLRNASVARRKSDQALNTRGADLRDKEAEVEQLKSSVDWLQQETTRLTQENESLTASNAALTAAHAAEVSNVRETSTRELDVLRSQHDNLSTQMEDRVRQEIESALAQKDVELRRLREELEEARDKVKELQQQIAASVNDNALVFRDEDYFDAACQKLCGHVQQWVLRFSKHSDSRRCRALAELHDDKITDRFDNALVDGSDADALLSDRVRRRDVFMSVVMTMVWEYIFTRYLFGMDREQRQKLKSLEKQLGEVGPRRAVHRWRATTLTLLSRRPAFSSQRESDTEAVALEIFGTLSRVLPPPSQVEAQLLESLRKVLRVAVNLSLEMRTQLAEYIMLPPLQPEYDTNGDLARQIFFNASLMNERSGQTTSNDELESQQAVVRIVLFPLVVKKGNDVGEGDDEVVVCPAQVLVARPGKDKKVSRMMSGDRMSVDANRSVHSIAPSTFTMDMGSNQF